MVPFLQWRIVLLLENNTDRYISFVGEDDIKIRKDFPRGEKEKEIEVGVNIACFLFLHSYRSTGILTDLLFVCQKEERGLGG
jgi:hypothetical protein